MTIISTDKIEEAKKMIRQAEKPIIVKAQDVEFNRKILEYGRFDVLFSPESLQGKRSLRSIDSGLDYVMVKAIGYSDKRDVFALLLSLGASTQQAKEAVE